MAKDSCRTERLIIDQGFIEEENGQNIITITNQSNLDEFSKSPKQDSHQINTDIQQIKPNKESSQETKHQLIDLIEDNITNENLMENINNLLLNQISNVPREFRFSEIKSLNEYRNTKKIFMEFKKRWWFKRSEAKTYINKFWNEHKFRTKWDGEEICKIKSRLSGIKFRIKLMQKRILVNKDIRKRYRKFPKPPIITIIDWKDSHVLKGKGIGICAENNIKKNKRIRKEEFPTLLKEYIIRNSPKKGEGAHLYTNFTTGIINWLKGKRVEYIAKMRINSEFTKGDNQLFDFILNSEWNGRYFISNYISSFVDQTRSKDQRDYSFNLPKVNQNKKKNSYLWGGRYLKEKPRLNTYRLPLPCKRSFSNYLVGHKPIETHISNL